MSENSGRSAMADSALGLEIQRRQTMLLFEG